MEEEAAILALGSNQTHLLLLQLRVLLVHSLQMVTSECLSFTSQK